MTPGADPPAEGFPGRPVLRTIHAGRVFARIYDGRWYTDGIGFRHFGPHPRGRFDPQPAGPPVHTPDVAVCYLASTLRCAVAETFGDARRVSPSPTQRLAVVSLNRDVRLADTRGRSAVQLGVAAGALRSRDRELTQSVARRLHDGTAAHGVLYEGWFTGETCVCLWERAADAVTLVDDRALVDPYVWADLLVIADELFYAVPALGAPEAG